MSRHSEPVLPPARVDDAQSTSQGHGAPGSDSESPDSARTSPDQPASKARFTIFAIPKPFVGEADRIQRNAIGSWRRLAPQAEVLLLGDDAGIVEFASEFGLKHVPNLQRNSRGTPLLDSAFEIATKVATTPILMYCNCDIIFLADLVQAIDRLSQVAPAEFIAYGRRTEMEIDRSIDFDDPRDVETLQSSISQHGRWESIICKEYFIFRHGTFTKIPAFAVGRGNWDSWMIRSSKNRSVPVIDMSNCITSVHQSHAYSHAGRSRWSCYVSGDEAKENERLAGGRNLISGSTPDWKLDERGLRRLPLSGLQLPFWQDLPRFLWLMKKLVVG